MKKNFLFFILTFICLSAYSQGIVFEENENLKDALEKAKIENKFVFIDCYAPWCVPCKWMSKNIFPQKEVGDFYNTHFINLSLNAETEENKYVVDKFVVTSFPFFIFLNPQGDVIHKAIGGMEKDEFIQLGENALDTTNNFKAISKKVKNGERSPEILEKYFDFIPYSDEKEALAIEYLNKLNADEKTSSTAWRFFRNYVRDTNCAPFLYFAKNINTFISKFGEEKVEEKMISLFQNSYKENRDYFKSLKKYSPKFYNEVELKLKKQIT
ncbi:Thioredoxin domain-containing protein (fragment) [uncultured Paludibacter sp.]